MAHTSLAERALYFFGIGDRAPHLSRHGDWSRAAAERRISAAAESHHVGRRDHPAARLSAADPVHHRRELLPEPHAQSVPAARRLHPDHAAPRERRHSRWRRIGSQRAKSSASFRKDNSRARARCCVCAAATKSSRGRRTRRSFRSGSINSGARSFRIKAAALSRNGRGVFRFRSRLRSANRSPPTKRTSRLCARKCSSSANRVSARDRFCGSISRDACLRGLKRSVFKTAITDGLDHTTLSRGKLLGVATALSRHLRQQCAERRIGIVLPPGKGAVVANVAVVLAGKDSGEPELHRRTRVDRVRRKRRPA